MSAQTFLIDYKMHKAASLLVSTSLSVKEIANNVGYEDQLVFSKAFKKKFGMSPKNYKTHKEMMDKFNEKQVDDHTGSSTCFSLIFYFCLLLFATSIRSLPDSVIILQLKHKFWTHSLCMVRLHL